MPHPIQLTLVARLYGLKGGGPAAVAASAGGGGSASGSRAASNGAAAASLGGAGVEVASDADGSPGTGGPGDAMVVCGRGGGGRRRKRAVKNCLPHTQNGCFDPAEKKETALHAHATMGLFKASSEPPVRQDTINADRGAAAAAAAAAEAAAVAAEAAAADASPSPSLHRTLTALTAEYDRLKRQQALLEAAVAEGGAVLARPRVPPRDLVGALAPAPLPDAATPLRRTKKSPSVSGGMTALPVAEDLLALDFSTPPDAPREFRALPFDAGSSVARPPSPLPSPGDFIAPDDVGDLLTTVLAQQKLILRLLAQGGGGGGGSGREGLAQDAVARLRADGVL